MNCQHCGNSFRTNSNLLHHQRTAKYCLLKRGGEVDAKRAYRHICKYCSKGFTREFNLRRHLESCRKHFCAVEAKVKPLEDELKDCRTKLLLYEETIREQKLAISTLQDKLENIAVQAVSRSTTTNNLVVQDLQTLTDEHLKDSAEHLNISHILREGQGYAEYALEHALKDRVTCVDYSRRKVKYKDKDGNVITDPEMSNLASKFFDSIKDKNEELIKKCLEEGKEKFGDSDPSETIKRLGDVCEEGGTFAPEVARVRRQEREKLLRRCKNAIASAAQGEKNDLFHVFVKEVCGRTA
jgi:hypothetical protein